MVELSKYDVLDVEAARVHGKDQGIILVPSVGRGKQEQNWGHSQWSHGLTTPH